MGGCGKHGILRPVPSRFWSSEGSHEEPSKDPSEGTVEGSPAGCFSQAAQRQRARNSVATATVASKARATCVFHRLHVVRLFTPFRPPNKTARTGCQPRCRRPRRRTIQRFNVVWRRDTCVAAWSARTNKAGRVARVQVQRTVCRPRFQLGHLHGRRE